MDGIRYEFDARPADGETMSVAEGISWLRMPLPMALNHINLWLLRDDRGWVIVDTGIDTRTTRDLWQQVFVDSMDNDPATHVVATHLHPDHVGCANWLVDRFGVDLWMTREEYLLCCVLVNDTGMAAPEEGVSFLELKDQIRYNLAVSALKSKKSSIEDISEALGFSDRNCFTRAFKRWSGVSPSAFRQNQKK